MSSRSSGGNLSRHIYSLQHMTAERVGLSVRLARRWSLRFPKRSMPLNCCSSLAASFFVFIPSLSCSFAMRHTRSCPAALLDQHSVCIILGTLSVASLRYFPGEYHLWRWVFNFQGSVQNKYLLDFCAAVHYTELIFRHSFQRFCSCTQRRNLKNFLLFKTVERIVYNLSKLWRCLYGKVEANRRYF